eukprot:scaffold292877_cov32-Tisochrysis_lutea.AAC.2
MAAEPSIRTVRARAPTAAIPRTIGRSEASLGAKPVATTASDSASAPTRMGDPLRKAPPPAVAEKTSISPPRSGSMITPHSIFQPPSVARRATPIEMPTSGRD